MGRYRFVSLVVLVPALAASLVLTGTRPPGPDDDFYAMRKNFELFGAFYGELVTNYHTRVDPERLMRAGMDAMLSTLDPWTDFFDEADNVEMDLRYRRILADVGLSLSRRDGRVTVLQPDFEAAAYRQGIRTGDVVISVQGQPVDSLSVPDIHQLLRGEPATVVEVGVERAGEGELLFRLTREAPIQKTVTFAGRLESDPGIAVLKLAVFGQGAASELGKAYQDLAATGEIRGVVLDLRGNPGGLVSEAIGIVGLFVPRGTQVVSMRGRASETTRGFRTESNPVAPDVPLVVLMDRSSASASEIVAGAVQDLDRGLVVGEPSFGKGLVQTVRPLKYNTSLKVTMSAYYAPSGRGIHRRIADGLGPAPAAPAPFTTAGGRPVREGFGIEPDLSVFPFANGPADRQSGSVGAARPGPGPLETALEREAAFFLFAGVLANEEGESLRDAAARARRLVLPNGTMERFRAWLETRGFEFRTSFEAEVEALDASLEGGDVRAALDRLRRAAAEDRERSFERESQRLSTRITQEVAARLMGPEEAVRALMPDDPWMQAAGGLLNDQSRYARMLQGS